MAEIAGFTLGSPIYQSARTLVYRGSDAQSNPVIIKMLNSAFREPSDIARVKQEGRLLSELQLPGIPVVLSQTRFNNTPVLIMSDEGDSLLEMFPDKMTQADALEVAIQLVKILAEIHNCNIVHKDIKPANITVRKADDGSLTVALVDFNIASRLSEEAQQHNLTGLDGSIDYISPEQTGRINRPVDYRSDFYSLGVTLYQLLSASLPFVFDDELKVIHAHLAVEATPLHQREPHVSEALSGIVAKLMSKKSGDRYASAFGLLDDLSQCQQQLASTGSIEPFALGVNDVPDRLTLSHKLYGREDEYEALLMCFELAAAGRASMATVGGYSGVGKTALIEELKEPLLNKSGLFTAGKFDQYKRNLPFSALLDALNRLIQQILAEPDEQLKQWRRKMRDALGTQGQLIIDLLPDLELILGKQPAVARFQGEEAKNRLMNLVESFINVFASEAHPLVIFLDDLQWADPSSLQLIQRLMSQSQVQYMLLVIAYRDNEVNASHPMTIALDNIKQHALVTDIELKPLELEHSNELIADILNSSPEYTLSLASSLQPKTAGNPFFLLQFLNSLYDEQLLYFDRKHRCWKWHEDKINNLNVSSNVVELVSNKINTLPKATRELIAITGCLGTNFNLAILTTITSSSAHHIAQTLWPALQLGLIKPLSKAHYFFQDDENSSEDPANATYKFQHDRIYEAAHKLNSDDDASQLHLRIGRIFQQQLSPEEQEDKLFMMVNHLNAGSRFISDEQECHQLAELNLRAGKKSMMAVAYHTANNFLSKGIAILGDLNEAKTKGLYTCCLDLARLKANCAYLCGDHDTAHDYFELALTVARSNYDKGQVLEMMVSFLLVGQRYSEGLERVLEALRLFNISLPLDPKDYQPELAKEMTAITTVIGDKDTASLMEQEALDDREMVLVHTLLQQAWTTGFIVEGKIELANLAALKILHLSLAHGTTHFTPFGYIIYAMTLLWSGEAPKRAYQFGKLAVDLHQKYPLASITPKINNLFCHFINHFSNPYKDNLPYYEQSYELCIQQGELWWGSWAALYQMIMYLEQGSDLEKVQQIVQRYYTYIENTGNESVLWLLKICQQLVSRYQDKHNEELQFCEQDIGYELFAEMGFDLGLFWHDFYQSSYYFHRRLPEKALEFSQRAEKTKASGTGIIQYPSHLFYHALILCSVYPDSSPEQQAQYAVSIDECQQALSLYAESGPDNYLAKALLILAEQARIRAETVSAMEYYDAAIHAAEQAGLQYLEALACELAGRFYVELGRERIAATYLNDAYAKYNLWGAFLLAKDLKQQFPAMLFSTDQTSPVRGHTTVAAPATRIATSVATSTHSGASQFDLHWLLKSTRTLALEKDTRKMLSSMMDIMLQSTGAQRACIVVAKEGELTLEAEGKAGEAEPQVLQALSLPDAGLPEEIITYVGRTHEEVLLDDACNEGMFTRSDYIKTNQCLSVVCVPVLSRSMLVAIAYLENNAAVGAFSAERMEILRFVSSQASLSIENALLRNVEHGAEFEYRVGGSVDPKSSCYVPREADRLLYSSLRKGEFCYVLNPRQMGKSSLRVNTMTRLENEGYCCVAIDITAIGSQQVTPEQWYAGIARIILAGLKLDKTVNLRSWWRQNTDISPVQRLMELIEFEVLPRVTQPIVIFIDEIDSVMSLPFNSDDFFASIRAMFNKRVDNEDFARLSFVLLGVALPYELMQDKKRTPFNIGVEIRLRGFRHTEAHALSAGLISKSDAPEVLLREVIAWTGGQPFLTQKVCRLLAQAKSRPKADGEKEWVAKQIFNKVIDNWEAQDHPEHLITIRTRILRSPNSARNLLLLYQQILTEGELAFDGSPLQEELVLSGGVVREWDKLYVANNIYSSVFNQEWITKELHELQLSTDSQANRAENNHE